MATKIYLKDGGLDSIIPDGYTALGLENGELKIRIGSTSSNVSSYKPIIKKQELDLSLIPYVDESKGNIYTESKHIDWSSTFPFLVGDTLNHYTWDFDTSQYIIIGSAYIVATQSSIFESLNQGVDRSQSPLSISSITGTFSMYGGLDQQLPTDAIFGYEFLSTESTLPVVPSSYSPFVGCVLGTFITGEEVYYNDGVSNITLGTVVELTTTNNGRACVVQNSSYKRLVLDLVIDFSTLPNGLTLIGVDSGADMAASKSSEIIANFPFINSWLISNVFNIPQTIELPTGKWIINQVLFTNAQSFSISNSFNFILYQNNISYASLSVGSNAAIGAIGDNIGGLKSGIYFDTEDDYSITDLLSDNRQTTRAVSGEMTFTISGDQVDPNYTMSGTIWIYIYGFLKPEI
jgi:hypothetical protein